MSNLEKKNNSDTITISGFGDICRMVGENTSDINILKQQSEVVGELKMEIATMRVEQQSIKQCLEDLKVNDLSILDRMSALAKGIVSFRYWQAGVLVIVLGTIATTLRVGVNITRTDQESMRGHLETKIQNIAKAQIKDSQVFNDKLDIQREDSKLMHKKLDKLIEVMIEHKNK